MSTIRNYCLAVCLMYTSLFAYSELDIRPVQKKKPKLVIGIVVDLSLIHI